MKVSAVIVLVLLASCQAPLPPSTPPLASTPPPLPPERPVASATVSGRVVDGRGRIISHAQVLVRPADAGCRPTGDGVGAASDESGEFLAVAEVGGPPSFSGCVVVEARSGGASGVATSAVEFTTASPRVRVDVRLESPLTLGATEAERLVRLLVAGINDPAQTPAELSLYILHGPEALRVALEQYRTLLERVTSVRAVTSPYGFDPLRFTFELRNAEGRTAHVDAYQEELTRLHSPLLDYGFRSERFINAYLRAISSGDAIRLSQVLNPDDIDFPVERAREIIVNYRRRYRDTATIRAEFVDVNERQNIIRWRLRGTGPAGEEVTEMIELGFGDGLIGIRGLNE